MIQSNFPWVESPFFAEIIKTKNLNEEQKELAAKYNRDGNNLVNIATGEKVKPSYNGQKLSYLKTNKTQYIFNNPGNTQSTFSLLLRNLFRKNK